MALRIKHAFTSGKPAGPDPAKVQGPHWDADHVITDATTGLPVSGALIPVGTIIDFAGHTWPQGWLDCSGQALSGAAYPALYNALVKSSNVDITIGTPAVISWPNHGLRPGDTVQIATGGGTLPTPIVEHQKYYIIAAGLAAGSFRISATYEGPAINTSGTQSGVQSAIHAPFGYSGGTFNLPDLRERVTAGASSMNASLGGVIPEDYAVGEVAGAAYTTIQIAHLPAHTHTVNAFNALSGNETVDHAHRVVASDSGSGTTGNLGAHTHVVTDAAGRSAERSDTNKPGSGGGSAFLQDGSQGGGTGQAYFADTAGNHAHGFSVSVGIDVYSYGITANHQHWTTIPTHATTPAGSGSALPVMQPTLFIRKLIYAGV